MTKIKKRVKQQHRYAVELKRKIAKEYLSGAASYGILAEEHGLRNKDVVKEFVKWYKRILQEEQSGSVMIKRSVNKKEQKPIDIEKDVELSQLKKQLELSELKVEMLETMIDKAEEELLIDIRKKSGTNQ